MIVDKIQGGLAKVTMSQEEAQVLLNGLTAAVINVGPDAIVGDCRHVNVEYLRGVLAGIAEAK